MKITTQKKKKLKQSESYKLIYNEKLNSLYYLKSLSSR